MPQEIEYIDDGDDLMDLAVLNGIKRAGESGPNSGGGDGGSGPPPPEWAKDQANVEVKGMLRRVVQRGGPGSGHHGHAGRPGEVGGSAPEDGVGQTPDSQTGDGEASDKRGSGGGDASAMFREGTKIVDQSKVTKDDLGGTYPEPAPGYRLLFHVVGTSDESVIEDISKNGLMASKGEAQQGLGWATSGPYDYSAGSPLVVFQVPEDSVFGLGHGDLPEKYFGHGFQKVNNNQFIFSHDVSPDDILAIYPVWTLTDPDGGGQQRMRADKILYDVAPQFEPDKILSFLKTGHSVKERSGPVEFDVIGGLRRVVQRGGPGSGHHGHKGRPGEVGGSAPDGGGQSAKGSETKGPKGGGSPSGVSGHPGGPSKIGPPSHDAKPASGAPKTSVGITSSRPGKPEKQVQQEMVHFEDKIRQITTLSDVKVQAGTGGWEGGAEPTWVVEYRGNGEALKLIAQTAKQYDQDAVLIMESAKNGGGSPVVDWQFNEKITAPERKAIESLLVNNGVGGWTWYKSKQGTPVLRAAAVPQWGGDPEKHMQASQILSSQFRQAGLDFVQKVSEARMKILQREGPNSYDTVLSPAA